jgi:sporulation protein YlmC with PRC-barrel domain
VPAGEEELRPSEQVKAKDGPVGRVSGLGIDLASRRITHVLVDAGHLWAKRTVVIPIEAVEHIGISVQLGLTKQQIRDLGQP